MNDSGFRIKIFGVGGGGNNTLDTLIEEGLDTSKVSTVALNTDFQPLKKSKADKTIRLGSNLTRGLGAGAKPAVGEEAALESKEEIKKELQNTDILFICSGMGGGTGTGAAPVIAKLAKEMQILTISIVTIPFFFEGYQRNTLALKGVRNLRENCDVCLVISNNTLISDHKDLYIEEAFALPDTVLKKSIESIISILSTDTKVGKNISLNEIFELLKDSGSAIISVESSNEGSSPIQNLVLAIQKACSSPMLDFSIMGAKSMVVRVKMSNQAPIEIKQLNQGVVTVIARLLGYQDQDALRNHVKINIVPEFCVESDVQGVEVGILACNFGEEDALESILQKQEKQLADLKIFE